MTSNQNFYGLDILPDAKAKIHPAMLELALYDNPEWQAKAPDKLEPHVHLRNAIQLLFKPHVFDLSPVSDRIIQEWCYTNALTVWGPSSMAKSGTVGMIVLMDLLVSPGDTLTRMVTNPLEEHKNRCYGNVLKWYANLPQSWQRWNPKAQPLGLQTVQDNQTAGIICFSNKPGDSWEDLKRKLGAHQKRNRVIGDEVQGCSETVLNIRVNMGASGTYKECFLGNPDSWHNPLGKHSLPKHYERSWVEKEQPDRWETKNKVKGKQGVCIVLDGRKSPSLLEPEKYPYLLQPDHFESIKEQYGEDSPLFWTYIIGRIPPGGLRAVLVNEADLERFEVNRSPLWLGKPMEIAAGDFAAEGVDSNILRRIRIGTEAGSEKVVLHCAEMIRIPIKVQIPDKSLQIAEGVSHYLKKWGIPIEKFVGDSTGNQGAIIDTIERTYGAYGAHRMHATGPASDRHIGHGQSAKQRYKNKATEIAYAPERLIRHGQLTGLDEKTCRQISTRNITLDGRLLIEEKRLWRERNGGESPDEFDALAMACQFAIEKGWITPGGSHTATMHRGGEAQWDKTRESKDRRVMVGKGRGSSNVPRRGGFIPERNRAGNTRFGRFR